MGGKLLILCLMCCWSYTYTTSYTLYSPYVKLVQYHTPYYYPNTHSSYVGHVPLTYNSYFPTYSGPQALYQHQPQTSGPVTQQSQTPGLLLNQPQTPVTSSFHSPQTSGPVTQQSQTPGPLLNQPQAPVTSSFHSPQTSGPVIHQSQTPGLVMHLPHTPVTSLFHSPPTPVTSSFHSHLNTLPTINILAGKPYMIEKTFTVVPMLVVPADNLNMITNGQVTSVSKKKPLVTLKTNNKDNIQCTPAVRITLDAPMTVYSVKTSIMFPSQISILHENTRIPIKIGAVIVPVTQDTIVSEENPIQVQEVLAIPTKPMQVDVDYVNNDKDVIIDSNKHSVIVENGDGTTISPEDYNDAELVNRNPPSAPAGIVQSTQPGHAHIEIFHNPKESPVLIALREESKKRI